MRLIISVVSHLDEDLIISLATLEKIAQLPRVEVICRDNKPTGNLKAYCEKHRIHYAANTEEKGFSENNNLNFKFYEKYLLPQEDDIFMLLNPDVQLSAETLNDFFSQLCPKEKYIYTANLYLDHNYVTHDDNIRTIPTFRNFVSAFMMKSKSTRVDRTEGLQDKGDNCNYWVKGAFLAINKDAYKELNGLNEIYHLYCEDIDFSVRAKRLGFKVKMFEDIKAIHYTAKRSRNIASKYFLWHMKSTFKFCLSQKGYERFCSSLEQ